jgi:hypothetical protein
MTDALTDAVRRIKGLQEDIERLKAGQDEEGEPRLFFTTQEQARARETTTVREQRAIEDEGHYNSVGYLTASYNDP